MILLNVEWRNKQRMATSKSVDKSDDLVWSTIHMFVLSDWGKKREKSL